MKPRRRMTPHRSRNIVPHDKTGGHGEWIVGVEECPRCGAGEPTVGLPGDDITKSVCTACGHQWKIPKKGEQADDK